MKYTDSSIGNSIDVLPVTCKSAFARAVIGCKGSKWQCLSTIELIIIIPTFILSIYSNSFKFLPIHLAKIIRKILKAKKKRINKVICT